MDQGGSSYPEGRSTIHEPGRRELPTQSYILPLSWLDTNLSRQEPEEEDLVPASSYEGLWQRSKRQKVNNFLVGFDEFCIKILTCPNHILRTLLPPPTAQNYSLRNRPHNRQLPDRISRITDCNFTVRMSYRNMYWLLYILDLRFVLFLCTTAVWQFAINEYVML